MFAVKTPKDVPEHLEHVATEEAIEEWPEFKDDAKHALDDKMNLLHRASGVNPDEKAREAERNLVSAKNLANGCPVSRGFGPGHKLAGGRHKFEGGKWYRWTGATWEPEQVT
jgi:hypothetical protein